LLLFAKDGNWQNAHGSRHHKPALARKSHCRAHAHPQHGLPCSCLLFAGMHMRLLDREELMMVENVCLTDDSWVVGDLTRTLTEGDGRGGRRLVGKL
jgi:hypothetical protein